MIQDAPRWLQDGPSGAILGHLGAILGHLGRSSAILGRSGAILGSILGDLGPSWGHLGPSGAVLGRILGHLEPSWSAFGAICHTIFMHRDMGHLSLLYGSRYRRSFFRVTAAGIVVPHENSCPCLDEPMALLTVGLKAARHQYRN